MKFDELDARMRVFETAHDHCVLPGIHMVARVDGRSFTRLTKDVHKFEAPYDKQGLNPVSGQTVTTRRRRIARDLELPMKDAYGDFVAALLEP